MVLNLDGGGARAISLSGFPSSEEKKKEDKPYLFSEVGIQYQLISDLQDWVGERRLVCWMICRK